MVDAVVHIKYLKHFTNQSQHPTIPLGTDATTIHCIVYLYSSVHSVLLSIEVLLSGYGKNIETVYFGHIRTMIKFLVRVQVFNVCTVIRLVSRLSRCPHFRVLFFFGEICATKCLCSLYNSILTVVTQLLCHFSITLGGFGIDRFYLEQWGSAVGKLVSFGGLGVWTILDVILVATGYLGPADGSLYIY